MVVTTSHADLRARKRVGVSDISKQFEAALKHGLKPSDLKGQFKKYMDKQSIVHKSTPAIYKGYVYWHSKERLITVIPLNQKWHKYIK